MIPNGHQEISDADVEAVVAVLRSDFLTRGPVVPRLEQAVAQYTGAVHGVAVCNATAALHLACLALELGPGDRLWTSAISFAASANCARYCGADVDFIDIDALTFNIDTAQLRSRLEAAQRRNALPKVIVTVHMAGQPPEQETIWQVAREFGVRVIEDAAHAIGATRHGERVGSCRWSDITVFSFHPSKLITTGEGGMCITNDASLAARMRLLRNHGITRDHASHTRESPADSSYQEQIALGFNYWLTDLQAALGVTQLQRLDDFVARRNAAALLYVSALAGLPVDSQVVVAGSCSAYHLYIVRLQDPQLDNLDVISRLRARDVIATLHYPALHLHRYYRELGFSEGMFPEAERYARSALSLPMFAAIDAASIDTVAEALRDVLAS